MSNNPAKYSLLRAEASGLLAFVKMLVPRRLEVAEGVGCARPSGVAMGYEGRSDRRERPECLGTILAAMTTDSAPATLLKGGIGMLKNATYNLMETAAVPSKGLHRCSLGMPSVSPSASPPA